MDHLRAILGIPNSKNNKIPSVSDLLKYLQELDMLDVRVPVPQEMEEFWFDMNMKERDLQEMVQDVLIERSKESCLFAMLSYREFEAARKDFCDVLKSYKEEIQRSRASSTQNLILN